jgi:class 3 adenylate cyclase
LLFTDIVGSTELVVALGDGEWCRLLDRHNETVRRCVVENGGRVVDRVGDGVFAAFETPTCALRAAADIRDAVQDLGVDVRAGVHAGEVELAGDELRGVAVHIGQRVSALAGPAEVLVSSTVRDLVAGGGTRFADRGTHHLKGLPGDMQLFALVA